MHLCADPMQHGLLLRKLFRLLLLLLEFVLLRQYLFLHRLLPLQSLRMLRLKALFTRHAARPDLLIWVRSASLGKKVYFFRRTPCQIVKCMVYSISVGAGDVPT